MGASAPHRKGVFLMFAATDNLAQVPDQQALDDSYLDSVICSKSRGMVHITAHFPARAKGKREFWALIRCNYPLDMLRRLDGYPALRDDLRKRAESELSPDIYYNLATYFGNSNDLHSLRGVWVDVDTVPHRTLDLEDAQRYAGIILGACDTFGLPTPWVIHTGRGLQCVWPFADAVPCDKRHWRQARKLSYTLRRLAEWWGELFEGMGLPLAADTQATNLGRLLRVPGTWNGCTMPPTMAHVLAAGVPCTWSAFAVLGVANADKQQAPPNAVAVLPTPALANAVAASRLERLQAWCAGRGGDIEGYRELYLHFCAVMMHGDPDVLDRLEAINARLVAPLGFSEVRHAANSKWYPYSNATIAARLGMTAAEAEAWSSACPAGYVLGVVRLPSWQLAQATGVDTRQPHRRRDEARAARADDKASKYAQIPILHAQGMSYEAIAKQIGKSLRTVLNHKDG